MNFFRTMRNLLGTDLADVAGSIDEPSEQKVKRVFNCSGRVRYLKPGMHLWLAIEVDGLYWPKGGEVQPDDGGRWTATIREDGSPGTFSVGLYAVSGRGRKKIDRWFEHGQRTDDYPGLTGIPNSKKLASLPGLQLL